MTNRSTRFKEVPQDILNVVDRIGIDPENLLEVLKEIEKSPQGLSNKNISQAARTIGIPENHAFGVKSFYSMLGTEPRENILRVCDGPVCWLTRASEGFENSTEVIDSVKTTLPGHWNVERSSCLGLCDQAPALLINTEQAGPIPIEESAEACQGWNGIPQDYSIPRDGEVRVILKETGKLDPDDIQTALNAGAYEGLANALKLTPAEVIDIVESSGLQGRGGAGFPVGRKWRFVYQAKQSPKYMIANADESEPLIFKDRILMDTNPQQLLEGMAIGGYACGANEGFIYVRGEYEKQALRLEQAIAQAEALGWLGENIQGSGFSFNIHVHRGAGAYICGEETALIESMEGNRGEPRLRPPYPPSYGFRGFPTAVNNVESFSVIPKILLNGTTWWKSLSNYSIPGTKLYMVLGHVKKPGLFEAPFGITLREVIEEFGGGLLNGSSFNFALTGGAAGTFVNSSKLDIPLDFSSSQKGISLGAGAFLICDERVSSIALLRELLHFFAAESCGKCTPCRVGTWRAYEILKSMDKDKFPKDKFDELRAISMNLEMASFCGLGQSVSIPINSALDFYEMEMASKGR
jgi:NADH:ubiquinone oxidoreductase subunit F (NADH-binding)/NADH:ubiquinone oxidoreductase subunit E